MIDLISKLSKSDKAWLAAVIDCDGCITIRTAIQSNRSHYYVEVKVGMSDRGVVDEILRKTGIGHMWSSPKSFKVFNGRKKMIYNWGVSHKKAKAFLEQIKDHLFIKKKQAEIAIALEKRKVNYVRAIKGKYGFVRLSDEELKERRRLYLELKELHKRPFVEGGDGL